MSKKRRVEFIEVYLHGDTSDDYQWFDNRGELIRCKDCKFWDGDDLTDNDCECSCNGGWWFPEDYCSHGERREEDEG